MTMAINSQKRIAAPDYQAVDGREDAAKTGKYTASEVNARIATYTFLLLGVFVPSLQGACLQQPVRRMK